MSDSIGGLVAAYAEQYMKLANASKSSFAGAGSTFSVMDETHTIPHEPTPADSLAPMMEVFDILRDGVIEARDEFHDRGFPQSMADLMAQELWSVMMSLVLTGAKGG